MQFARLGMTGVVPYGVGATVFTATSKTVVRTMDLIVAGSSGYVVVKLNDTGSDVTNPVWYFGLYNLSIGVAYPVTWGPGGGLSGSISYTAQWKGGLVMNSGDYLYVYSSSTSILNLIVCGVTGV